MWTHGINSVPNNASREVPSDVSVIPQPSAEAARDSVQRSYDDYLKTGEGPIRLLSSVLESRKGWLVLVVLHFKPLFIIIVCGMCEEGQEPANTHMRRSENNFGESVLFCHHGTQGCNWGLWAYSPNAFILGTVFLARGCIWVFGWLVITVLFIVLGFETGFHWIALAGLELPL